MFLDIFSNMHTVFFISDKQLCYEVFERNDIIETKAAIFFQKKSGG